MQGLLTETLVSPAKATHHAPGRPHISTIWRWMTKGSRGVFLESVVCAGRRYTSVEAIDRFIAATNAAANGEPPPVRTPRQRELAIQRAGRDLGIDVAHMACQQSQWPGTTTSEPKGG